MVEITCASQVFVDWSVCLLDVYCLTTCSTVLLVFFVYLHLFVKRHMESYNFVPRPGKVARRIATIVHTNVKAKSLAT